MFDHILDILEDAREHPWEFIGDVIGAVCLFIIMVGLMFAPLLIS